MEKNYSNEAIQKELEDEKNIYHIIFVEDLPAGFSKIVLNSKHPNIKEANATKLDRIYLLSKFFDRKIGLQLLNFNINFSKRNNQIGIWLFTWIGNERAINFYKKNEFLVIGEYNFQVSETHYNLNHQLFLHIKN
jgi:diamine N-acetyltransferase